MIEVKSVIDDSFTGDTLYECLEAGVLIARMKADAGRGENNVFGRVLIHARKYYVEFEQKKDRLNDPKVTWYEMAAARFKSEYSSAVAAGAVAGYTKKEVKLFENACQTIAKAMTLGADFLERDEASGNFVLSGKSKLEQWNKKFAEELDNAQQAAALEAAKRENPGLFVVSSDVTTAEKAANGNLFDGVDPELANELLDYCNAIIKIAEQKGKTAMRGKPDVLETGPEKAMRLITGDLKRVQGILIDDFAGLKKASQAA